MRFRKRTRVPGRHSSHTGSATIIFSEMQQTETMTSSWLDHQGWGPRGQVFVRGVEGAAAHDVVKKVHTVSENVLANRLACFLRIGDKRSFPA
jgi:hypothetical protein